MPTQRPLLPRWAHLPTQSSSSTARQGSLHFPMAHQSLAQLRGRAALSPVSSACSASSSSSSSSSSPSPSPPSASSSSSPSSSLSPSVFIASLMTASSLMTIDGPAPTCDPLGRAPSLRRHHRHRCLGSGSGSLRRLRNLLASDAGSQAHDPSPPRLRGRCLLDDCLWPDHRPSSSPVRPPRGRVCHAIRTSCDEPWPSIDRLPSSTPMSKADFAALPPTIQRKYSAWLEPLQVPAAGQETATNQRGGRGRSVHQLVRRTSPAVGSGLDRAPLSPPPLLPSYRGRIKSGDPL
ncbi:hypothetical protein XA68_10543 [Ophiocordyceps unilateralis]|uniref:Uncharacterized protein n=1 Tax=Ophiocordyceps unilateralis TaxID=268505 RepID=A0A2A9PIF5_OPHUN|nr:hypothetical protein XA68_10543 [Ophiocordyceps unilateralis]